MSKRAKNDPIAVIDIGSSALRLKIAQSSKNKLRYIEALSYPLKLGRDTFDTGKISFEKAEKTCAILKNFLTVSAEYGVTDVKAIATTAIREATNRAYILDQIKIKTGLTVQVIDDFEEKFYIYKLMMHMLDDELKKSTIMVHIGSGNVGVAVVKNGIIPYVQHIKTGSLRISEIFTHIQDYSAEYYHVVEEYLDSFTLLIERNLTKSAMHFVASSHEISLIAQICGAVQNGIFFFVPKDIFKAKYDEVKHKTADRICLDYDLDMERAEILLPAMSIFNNLLELSGANQIIAPNIYLLDALIMETLYPVEFARINKEFDRSAVESAKWLAGRFKVEQSHINKVEKYALKIFDKMKKIHGMGVRAKLLLQTASVLHDVGKFVNGKHHEIHSYNIISGLDLVGLNKREVDIVANICLFHSGLMPGPNHLSYDALNSDDQVLVSKLAAILRLANALDRGINQKFSDIDVKITEKKLIITIQSNSNTELENWVFNAKGLLFEEVFGLKAELNKRRG